MGRLNLSCNRLSLRRDHSAVVIDVQAISKTTLLDDVYQEDTTTTDFEAHIAALCGHEAGLFVITGTMANQLALRAHLTQPPHGILCDARSHIAEFEGGGIAH